MSKVYKRVLFRVESFYKNGQPAQLTYIREEDQVELSTNIGQNHFILGYMEEKCMEPKPIPEGAITYL